MKEFIARSWYDYDGGKDSGLHPFEGETSLNYSGPTPPYDYLEVEKTYSWMKAPRFREKPMEVGLIRATAIERDGHLTNVHLSGDFFVFPAASLPDLEAALEGVEADAAAVEAQLTQFFQSEQIELPGVTPSDIAVALLP